jgi:hypothetical protein
MIRVVYKGGKGSGNFGHKGIPGKVGGSVSKLSMVPNGITFRYDGPEARAEYDGSISINRNKWLELSDGAKRGILAHEVVHHAIEDWVLKDNSRWDEAESVLTLNTDRNGAKWFLGGNLKIGEAIAETIGNYLGAKDLPYATQKTWDWAKRSIEGSGYNDAMLQRRIAELYNEANK